MVFLNKVRDYFQYPKRTRNFSFFVFLLILESEAPKSRIETISNKSKAKSGRVVSVQLTFTLPDSINCFDRCLENIKYGGNHTISRKRLIVVRSSCQPSFGIKICV